MSPQYPIVTERLLLRPLDPVGDVDAVLDYHSRPDVMRYLGLAPRDRDGVREFLTSPRTRSSFDVAGQVISLAVVDRDTGALIGDASLVWSSAIHRRGEFGCVLNPAVHRRGYATEVGGALLDYAFGGLDLHRVIARCDERNEASAAMLRRIGFRPEARLVDHEQIKGAWVTELRFAILDEEWRSRC